MGKLDNKTTKVVGTIAAIVIALIAVLTYASTQIGSVDKRLSSGIAEVAAVERSHYTQVINRLMQQSQDIGEIKGTLGRIENKIDAKME